jgi:hypothetical protein
MNPPDRLHRSLRPSPTRMVCRIFTGSSRRRMQGPGISCKIRKYTSIGFLSEPVGAAGKEHNETGNIEKCSVYYSGRTAAPGSKAQRLCAPLLSNCAAPTAGPATVIGDAVHKPSETEPVYHQDPRREDVEDVSVVVRRPSCKRHEHGQLLTGALRWQGDEPPPPPTEKFCQVLGGRVVLIGSPQSH